MNDASRQGARDGGRRLATYVPEALSRFLHAIQTPGARMRQAGACRAWHAYLEVAPEVSDLQGRFMRADVYE